MNGLDTIMDSIKEMMNELFDNCVDRNKIMRSLIEHLGVTDTDAILDVALEPGFNKDAPYPILHFLVTLAKDINDNDAGRISIALNELNHVIAVGEYPAFGAFCYYPKLHQIFLSYRIPVNPEVPEDEIINLRYYFGTLYQQLDIFADFIMFLCDTKGRTLDLDDYIDYLQSVQDLDDMEARTKALSERLDKIEAEMRGNE
jgi:hypothetical protein